MRDYDKILQYILDVGEEMVISGAEINRVENSIYRMCESYGATRINVFIITSNIQTTMEFPDGNIITHIRRIVRNDVNFDRLDYLNDLSRYICKNVPEPEEIGIKLEEVLARKQQRKWMKFIGAVLVAGGFTVFFGGNWGDGIAAAIMGVVIVCMEMLMYSREKNMIVYNFVISLVAGFTALILVKLGVGQDSGQIMIGGIMLLIPGIAMTNSMRDMIIGDIASGMLRLVNSLLSAAAIACGFALSIIVMGGAL